MIIMPSAEIRLNYNSVVEKCRETGQPVYLTKNGFGELVVMDIKSFEKRQQDLAAYKLVLDSITERLAGSKDYSLDELKDMMQSIINEKE